MPKMKDNEDGWVTRAAGQLRDDELLDGRTNNVSVTWGATRLAALANIAATGLDGPFHAAEVTKINQKQGRVMPSSMPGNPNHCNLFGLTVKDFNNLFS
jgi:hypothetical protein